MSALLYRLDHLSGSEVYLIVIALTLIVGYSFTYFADRKSRHE